jgi:parvulin-like peptidyl-prolyl isomerase
MKIQLFKLVLTLLILLALSVNIFAAEEVEFAASINGEIIPVKQFEQAFEKAKQHLIDQEDIELETEEGLLVLAATKRFILDEMIDFALLNQLAKTQGVKVSANEVEARIKKVQLSFPSEDDFLDALLEDKISLADLHQGTKEELLIEKLTAKLSNADKINEKDIEKFYAKNKELFEQPKRIHLYQMLLPSLEEAQQVSEKIQKEEATFQELAKLHSIDQLSSEDGGDIGFIEERQLPDFIKTALVSLNCHELSTPIPEPGSDRYYLIKCGDLLQQEVTDISHSKEQIKKFLIRNKEQNFYERWFEQQKRTAKIEINQELFPKLKEKPSKKGSGSKMYLPQSLEKKPIFFAPIGGA